MLDAKKQLTGGMDELSLWGMTGLIKEHYLEYSRRNWTLTLRLGGSVPVADFNNHHYCHYNEKSEFRWPWNTNEANSAFTGPSEEGFVIEMVTCHDPSVLQIDMKCFLSQFLYSLLIVQKELLLISKREPQRKQILFHVCLILSRICFKKLWNRRHKTAI